MEFSNGQSVATISLTILNDNLAELPEVTFIRLLKVTESGSTLEGKGAQLGKSLIKVQCTIISTLPNIPVSIFIQNVIYLFKLNKHEKANNAYMEEYSIKNRCFSFTSMIRY